MEEPAIKLKTLIEDVQSILITSHISPDPDAISSTLLLLNTLSANYPQKDIKAVLEERPNRDLKFLKGYEQIEFTNLKEAFEKHKPELLIIADANKLDRISRQNGQTLKDYTDSNSVKVAVVDHHESHDKDETDIYINNGYPASAEEIYNLLFEHLGMKKPDGYADATLVGIISDTYRFKYNDPRHRETFSLVSDLIDAGGDIEKLENTLEQYTKPQLEVIGHLVGNLKNDQTYNYSFITDDFAQQWRDSKKSADDFKTGTEYFVNQFIRNIAPNKWGFIVSPELDFPGTYSVSFRAEAGVKDVSLVAAKLGGGGHKPAAGAKFPSVSANDALKQVLAAVENAPES